jgi:hypothetical protein
VLVVVLAAAAATALLSTLSRIQARKRSSPAAAVKERISGSS